MYWANRNAFFYVLDRVTCEFLRGGTFVKQTWAEGLDAKGRAIAKEGLAPSAEGVLVYPSIQGAANWHSPSYSPQTGLFYLNGQLAFVDRAAHGPLRSPRALLRRGEHADPPEQPVSSGAQSASRTARTGAPSAPSRRSGSAIRT